MSVRLHLLVEGETEERFVGRVLAPHLGVHGVFADARSVETRRTRAAIHRGGLSSFDRARRDLERWMKEDYSAVFSTMFDLYALPDDFPGMSIRSDADAYARVRRLERALEDEIGDRRFVPYLQLHEFEALVLAEPGALLQQFPESTGGIAELERLVAGFESPELIDDGVDTAPSKRIIAAIPEYAGRKASAGPLVTERIGMAALRERCPHFGEWVARLEQLGGTAP
jgi:hypothetical protein